MTPANHNYDGGPVGCETTRSPIEISFAELHEALCELDNNIDRLASKITPVRNTVTEQPSPDLEKEERPACASSLRETIIDEVKRVNRLSRRLHTLHNEIEL